MTTTEYRALAAKGAELKATGYGWANVLDTVDSINKSFEVMAEAQRKRALTQFAPRLAALCTK